jgi:hypothetical protein
MDVGQPAVGFQVLQFLANEPAVRRLRNCVFHWMELMGVQPNPRLSHVYKGVELAKKEKVGALPAVSRPPYGFFGAWRRTKTVFRE